MFPISLEFRYVPQFLIIDDALVHGLLNM